MNKLSVVVLLVLVLPLLSGCDLFRKMAGRPTSDQIEAKRLYIEQQEKGHRNRLDSLKEMQKQITDSLEILDSIRAIRSSGVQARRLPDDVRDSLSSRYYIIIGAFGNAGNADKCLQSAVQSGYAAVKIRYLNGFTAVGICPCDELADAYASLRSVRESGFCPDAWILENAGR